MTLRSVCLLALVALSIGCAGRSQTVGPEPTATPVALETSPLAFPAIDSGTLASLSALLERLAQNSSLVSMLTASEPRMYALFRELEAAQQRLTTGLATPDATGSSLYDRLSALMARTDSVFRALEERNRQAPRP
jgi:hypothetical protein